MRVVSVQEAADRNGIIGAGIKMSMAMSVRVGRQGKRSTEWVSWHESCWEGMST